jgi:two-component system response regulator DesR
MAGERVIDPALAAATLAGEGTVRNYLSAAIAKTGARNRTEATRTAEERGWL